MRGDISMANGQVAVTFDGVNLDNCIKQGLELSGFAKCPYCKQIFTFQINLHRQAKLPKYPETRLDREIEDNYDVSIDFSRDRGLMEALDFLGEPEKKQVEPPCIPCNGCTPNCERLANR
jgi:dihydrodipicolinate reductase